MINKIILIAGVARSGTSWIGQIFNSSGDTIYKFQPLFSYAFKNYITHNTDYNGYVNCFEQLAKKDDDFLEQKDKIKSGEYPNLKKSLNPTTLVFKENKYQYLFTKMISLNKKLKMIGVIRNPCAVINSWVKNLKEFPPGSVLEDEWRFGACKNQGKEENFFGFYKWQEVANMYLDLKEKFPDRIMVVRYEDIVINPIDMTKKMFQFTNIKFEDQTKEFLLKSTSTHNESYYSVYKDKKVMNKWKYELPQSIRQEIEIELKGTRLENFFKPIE